MSFRQTAKRFLIKWIYSTNHKSIGTIYFIFGIYGGAIGTMLSMLIRVELGQPGTLLGEQVYNIVVTSHALVIIFLMVMPVIVGALGNWLYPMMLGMPDIILPRLNNLSL